MFSPINYIREVVAEAKNVTWPTRTTLIQLSIVVICISMFVAVFLGTADYLFVKGLGVLTTVKNQPPAALPTITEFNLNATPSVAAVPTLPAVTAKPIKKTK